jgi:hypothetical protein
MPRFVGLRGKSHPNFKRTGRARLATGATTLALVATAFAAEGAQAATLSAGEAVDRSCSDGLRVGQAGVDTTTVDSPGVAMVSAGLTGADGNWDLSVYEARSGELVAGSAYASGDEIAQGFATAPGELIVQACRRSGPDDSADVSVQLTELTEPAPRMQMVRVATPTDDAEERLTALGIDLTEHGGPGYVDAVLHGPADGVLLEDNGFTYQVLDPDLLQSTLAARAAERRAMRRGAAAPGLPSGRDEGTYRRLVDYSEEMQRLAKRNKRLVRYFTLPFETYEGRKVEAIEVGPKLKRRDGRPTFVITGVHHAREWPSAEHTLEFAYELIKGWKSKNQRIRRLMKRSRVVFVPIVNPDGFNLSREAGVAVADSGRDAPAGDETANLVIPYEYHRKNCAFTDPNSGDGGDCTQAGSNNGVAHFGVDPNRNYGGFWGGPGASASDSAPFGESSADYRGPGPFSEPETRNIQKLVSKRQVVTLITNHTFSNLVLRPPGVQAAGNPPDARVLKRLADAMAGENGYSSQFGFQLYDTTGTTEDWSYWSTGGLGYTFEIGPDAFHPNYDSMIAEYRGTTEAAGEGGGNRAAYLTALRSTTNRKRHSVIKGEAPGGAILTLRKSFRTPTSPVLDGAGEEGDVIRFRDRLKSVLRVRRSGRFTWHVNPSTRPLVDPRRDLPEPRRGKPSDPVEFSGTPGPDAAPCADFDTEDPMCWNDHPFRVKGGKGIDNGTATVRVSWADPASDWDMKVFRDSDGDGSSEGETGIVGSSGNSTGTNIEEATIVRPGLRRGKYVVRVINYAAASPYDGLVTFGKTEKGDVKQRRERWTLTCRASRGGPVLDRSKVLVDRGDVARVDLSSACSA